MLNSYKLCDICSLSKGVQINTSQLNEMNPYKYINGGVKESGYFTDYNTDENTVLISEGGSCGYVSYLNEKAWIGCHCYRLFNLQFDARYLYWALKANQKNIENLKTGAAIQNIKKTDLYEFSILLSPNEAHQRWITSLLDKIDRAIYLQNQKLFILDELQKSRFIEMFGEYSATAKLSDVAVVSGGLTKNSKREKLPLKMPYLRVANVAFGSIDVSEMLNIGLTEDEFNKTLLRDEDLLFVEGNGSPDQIGRVAIWRDEIKPCVHQNHLIKARFNKSIILPVFAMYYFMTLDGRNQIKRKAVSTSGLYTLSVLKVSDLVLPVPSLKLQYEFSSFVEQVDKSKYGMLNRIKSALLELVHSQKPVFMPF